MRPVLYLCAVFLVCSCQKQGSSAVVFVQRGKDFPLDVITADALEEDVTVFWKFNKKDVLVRFLPGREPSVATAYKGRIEFPEKKYSLKLKDLQEADTGVYTAEATGTDASKIIAEYHVTVQGPVSPVNLTVDSVSNNSDSCNITVTCRAQDSHINSTFRCDTKNCSQEGGERSEVTASGAFLHVYLENDSIICNHSNQVSGIKDMKNTQDFCPRHNDPDKQYNSNSVDPGLAAFIGILILILILIISAILVIWHRKRGKYRTRNTECTINAASQANPVVQSPTVDAPGSSPTSTYCMVGQSMGSTQTRGKTQVQESLYAQVEKPARS
ncbi:SLAM family member 9-like [Pempheris klunzingeri]|uniref:SLAM family member 9-like n=1 Tax=Pempheris klunzingeri TaxID=3127111 RepID=UPI00398028DD